MKRDLLFKYLISHSQNPFDFNEYKFVKKKKPIELNKNISKTNYTYINSMLFLIKSHSKKRKTLLN